VGTWCQRLVRGLDEYAFHVVSIVDGTPAQSMPVPANVPSLTTVPISGEPIEPERGAPERQHRRAATHAAVLLCRGMLDDSAHSAAMFRSALRRLAAIGADGTHPLAGVPLAAVLLDAWRAAGGQPGAGPAAAQQLPRPSIADAQHAAELLEAALRPLAAQVPFVEVAHPVDGGLSILVALAAKWRTGIPFVLTEHDRYLNHPLLAHAGAGPARAILLRFLCALTRLGYAEAAAAAPPSEQMRRWALHHGAQPAQVTVVPPGLDPHDHPPLRTEPPDPVIIWSGPEAELSGALRAFEVIRQAVPAARLVVIGPTPNSGRRPDGVNFTGPVTGYRALYAAGTVLALSGAHEAMPYPLIEAMFCGRATVCTASGGLAAMVGPGVRFVPPGDPAQLAAACLALLNDPQQRRELGCAARERARALFSVAAMRGAYRSIYTQARSCPPAPTLRLPVSL
jgi:glycosyltransferase involved in cell wall biosynthesis